MNDPDKGAWTYQYNALGELLQQTDAKGQTRTMRYDALGRMVKREDRRSIGAAPEKTASWHFDTSPYGIGQVAQEIDEGTGYSKTLTYDSNLGRPILATTSIDAAVYTEQTTYDPHSRVLHNVDASGRGILHVYEANGLLWQQKEATGNQVHYTVLAMSPYGQVSRERRGDSILTNRGYNGITGRIQSIVRPQVSKTSPTTLISSAISPAVTTSAKTCAKPSSTTD